MFRERMETIQIHGKNKIQIEDRGANGKKNKLITDITSHILSLNEHVNGGGALQCKCSNPAGGALSGGSSLERHMD